MFNEESIYGISYASKDGKNRVIMPSYTGAAKEDQLVIIKYHGFYKILRKDVLDAQIKVIQDSILENVRKGSISNVQALETYRDSIVMDIVRTSRVDGQGRIIVGDLYSEDRKVTLVGANDGVYMMNDEAYKKYQTELSGVKKLGKTGE